MKIKYIEALHLPESWWLCLKAVLEEGYEYKIDKGSFEGQKRKELDLAVIRIKHPGIEPIIPVTIKVPPPTSMNYVQEYLSYLMSSHKETNEDYTYGEDIEPQLEPVIEMLKNSPNTNQSYIAIGDKNSINLESPQCLRGIHCRVRYNKLNFIVYFRSWDLWGGYPSNLAAIQLLKDYMATEIGVEDGELIALSGGLHLYDHAWDWANIVTGGLTK